MGFEHLGRTQEAMAGTLGKVLDDGMMPQTLLFSGPRGSSRLTGALDLAFTLTGEEEKRDMLSSRQICLFLSRPMRMVLNAASSLFCRQLNRRSRLFYIQTVRTVLMQYHQSVVPLHRENAGIKGKDERIEGDRSVCAAASLIDELLMALEEDRDYERGEAERIVSEIDGYLTDAVLTLGKKTAGATIEEIRAVQAWLGDGIDEKIVIFENPEDYAEGAKNSLLKLLEEPPEHAHLILISRSPSRLLETILSRCRKFPFPELSAAKVSRFIGEEFSIYGNYSSFDAFFFEEGAEEKERKAMEGYLSLFSQALFDGRALTLKEEEDLFSGLEKSGGYEHFRESMLLSIGDRLRKGMINGAKARKIYSVLSSLMTQGETYNVPFRLTLDLILREVSNV